MNSFVVWCKHFGNKEHHTNLIELTNIHYSTQCSNARLATLHSILLNDVRTTFEQGDINKLKLRVYDNDHTNF